MANTSFLTWSTQVVVFATLRLTVCQIHTPARIKTHAVARTNRRMRRFLRPSPGWDVDAPISFSSMSASTKTLDYVADEANPRPPSQVQAIVVAPQSDALRPAVVHGRRGIVGPRSRVDRNKPAA